MTPRQALEKVVGQVGGQAAFAARLKKKPGNVYYWLRKGRLPSDYCPTAERASREVVAREGGEPVVCEVLCPGVEWGVVRSNPLPAAEPQASHRRTNDDRRGRPAPDADTQAAELSPVAMGVERRSERERRATPRERQGRAG